MTFSIVARTIDAFGVVGEEANLEMRMTPNGIDSRVLRALREAVG